MVATFRLPPGWRCLLRGWTIEGDGGGVCSVLLLKGLLRLVLLEELAAVGAPARAEENRKNTRGSVLTIVLVR